MLDEIIARIEKALSIFLPFHKHLLFSFAYLYFNIGSPHRSYVLP